MIGLMRHKIEIQGPTKIPDGRGGYTKSFSTIDSVWGVLAPLSATEYLRYKTVTPEISCKIIIRYRDDISIDNIFMYRSKKYKISGIINPATKNEMLKILVQEVTNK